MKINNRYDDSASAQQARDASRTQETASTQQARAARAAVGAGGTSGSDQVNLSSLASAIQGAMSDSAERSAFLEGLAADFAAGAYQPDPQATARGIVDDTLLHPDKPEGS